MPPVIYTTTSWWTQCTGNSADVGSDSYLWIARYNGRSDPGTLPAPWSSWALWQWSQTDGNPLPGDQDVAVDQATLNAMAGAQ